MDSLTQIALGAAVGQAGLSHSLGRRALVWGAACGTLPDLDVLIPMGDAVSDFTYHRSFSHSLFVLAVLTPIVVWLIRKTQGGHWDRQQLVRVGLVVYAIFATHVLLDSFTVYGTQIFWPIPVVPMSWSTIFIIDPLYTLPLLVGIIGASWGHYRGRAHSRLNTIGLAMSTLYLTWSVLAKWIVTAQVETRLADAGIQYDRLVSTASPFNTILWRLIARKEGGYYEIYHSLFDDKSQPLDIRYFKSDDHLLAHIGRFEHVKRLQWFTHGFYKIESNTTDVIISDLRMGAEPQFVFSFKVAEANPAATTESVRYQEITPVKLPFAPDYSQLDRLWPRLTGDLPKLHDNEQTL